MLTWPGRRCEPCCQGDWWDQQRLAWGGGVVGGKGRIREGRIREQVEGRHLCIGEFSRGPPALLLVEGEEGADPAEVERKEREEVARRERASLTREGMEEEEGGGEGVEGERAKTGTEEKCSRGILILSEHLEQTWRTESVTKKEDGERGKGGGGGG